MNIIEQISEDEMIAVFLKGELNSARFFDALRTAMQTYGVNTNIITNPNSADHEENELRRKVFGAYRGYGENAQLFEDFPTDVVWYRVTLSKNEVLKIKYINYSYWNDLSDNTRLSSVAAKNIQRGYEAFHVDNTNFLKAAESLKQGSTFPEMILVARDFDDAPVVLEGHLRLTAYALAPAHIPDKLSVIVGISQNITEWPEYGDELPEIQVDAIQLHKLITSINLAPKKYLQKIVAIDGGGGSGKSTLAKHIQKYIPESHIIHIDDFYIGPWGKRLDHTNYDVSPMFDWGRFRHEVLEPVQKNEEVIYHVYSWNLHNIDQTVSVTKDAVIIVEGGYTTQKDLASFYDFKIWVDMPEDMRLKRVLARDGEHMRFLWKEDWLPVERNYMRMHNPKARADAVVAND